MKKYFYQLSLFILLIGGSNIASSHATTKKELLIAGYIREKTTPQYYIPKDYIILISSYVCSIGQPFSFECPIPMDENTFFINLFPEHPNTLMVCYKKVDNLRSYGLQTWTITPQGVKVLSRMDLTENLKKLNMQNLSIKDVIFCHRQYLVFNLHQKHLYFLQCPSLPTLSPTSQAHLKSTGYGPTTAFKMLYWHNQLLTIPINTMLIPSKIMITTSNAHHQELIKSWDLTPAIAQNSTTETASADQLSHIQAAIAPRRYYHDILKDHFFTIATPHQSIQSSTILVAQANGQQLVCRKSYFPFDKKQTCCYSQGNIYMNLTKLFFHQFAIVKEISQPYLCVYNQVSGEIDHQYHITNTKETEFLYALLSIKDDAFLLITILASEQYKIYIMSGLPSAIQEKSTHLTPRVNRLKMKQIDSTILSKEYNLYQKHLFYTGTHLLVIPKSSDNNIQAIPIIY